MRRATCCPSLPRSFPASFALTVALACLAAPAAAQGLRGPAVTESELRDPALLAGYNGYRMAALAKGEAPDDLAAYFCQRRSVGLLYQAQGNGYDATGLPWLVQDCRDEVARIERRPHGPRPDGGSPSERPVSPAAATYAVDATGRYWRREPDGRWSPVPQR